MKNQSPLTILASVKQDEKSVGELKALLEKINKPVEDNEFIPFAKITTIHFARFVIIDPPVENKKSSPTWLAFSTNYDGGLDDHLNELYTKAGHGFDQVYSHCEGYKGGDLAQFVEYMKAHMMPFPNAFYIGHRGLTVGDIKKQNEIRNAIQLFLNEQRQDKVVPDRVKENIINHLKQNHPRLLDGAPPVIHLKSLRPTLLTSLATALLVMLVIGFVFSWKVLGCTLLVLVGLMAVLYFILRIKEALDDQIEIKDDAGLTSRISGFTNEEDFTAQNQLTHLVTIKPGWFRLLLLKLVLWGINLLAVTVFNKGKLGNIPTIHFARWVVIDKGRRLIFFSNFDGSWESYLGDFVDKAAVGLTAVWSNTRLFPKTKNLICKGATDEERFKYWARVNQITTQVWFSAYKTLSVVNVINNNEIHQGLLKKMSDEEIIQWLRKL